MDNDHRIHPSPFAEWYASQDTSAGGVWLCDKTSDEKVLVRAADRVGAALEWNVTQDGTGIYVKRDFA